MYDISIGNNIHNYMNFFLIMSVFRPILTLNNFFFMVIIADCIFRNKKLTDGATLISVIKVMKAY